MKDKDEHRAAEENPDRDVTLNQQSVYLETESASWIEGRYDIVDRQAFHDEHGVWPEDCKLMQVQGETGLREDGHGIVVESAKSKPGWLQP